MRKFRGKKVLAIAAASLLAMSMMGSGMSAMAATVSIDWTGNTSEYGTGYTFAAYQVFAGAYRDGKLTDIVWGTGFDGLAENADLLTLYNTGKEASDQKTSLTAEEVADFLNGKSDDSEEAVKFAKIAEAVITTSTPKTDIGANENSVELADGYYLIVNNQVGGDGTQDDSGNSGIKNVSLLQIAGSGEITIKNKTARPSVEKKIWEERLENQSVNAQYSIGEESTDAQVITALNSEQWNDVADYDIGDNVPFKLTATIPANTTTNYTTYSVRFEDVMDENLKVNLTGNPFADYKVYTQVGDAAPTEIDLTGNYYRITTNNTADQNTIVANFPNIKEITGFDSAKDFKIFILFTAKLTSGTIDGIAEENKVKLYFSNDYMSGGEGHTEEDAVAALTFDIDINKYAEDVENLAGAVFELYKVTGDISGNDLETEAKTLSNADGDPVLDADGDPVIYYGLKSESGLTKINLSQVESTNVYNVDNTVSTTEITTTASGDITIHGLDRDTYILVEKTAPNGYNILKKGITVVIENVDEYDRETYEAGQYKTDENAIYYIVNVNDEAQESNIVDVENKSGSTLPETGGTGTMIFYAIGTVLMAGAVFYVTSRGRRKDEEA